MLHSAPAVVVGVDGSKAATNAARWAVDEAVSRDIPLRLVCVIEPTDWSPTMADEGRLGAARTVLYDAQRAVEATGKPVKIETEILRGRPLTKLMHESRSVAVIRRPAGGPATAKVSRVVVQADGGAVLRRAFEEARLRQAPLRAISVSRAAGPDDADGKRWTQAQLSRRVARWTRLYPDVPVEFAVVRGSVEAYLASGEEPDQLFVADARACYHLCGAHNAGRSVLATRASNL